MAIEILRLGDRFKAELEGDEDLGGLSIIGYGIGGGKNFRVDYIPENKGIRRIVRNSTNQ